MKTTDLTITNGADQFYPTPPSVAEKMLEGIDWKLISTVLEPSAGKGDLILAASKAKYKIGRYYNTELDVDAVEIDPYLREILKYNFSEEKIKEYRGPYMELDRMYYRDATPEQKEERDWLEQEYKIRKMWGYISFMTTF